MQSFFTTTLSAAVNDGTETTIYLNNVPTPDEGYLVIDYSNSTKREVIYYTSKGANYVTCPSAAAGRGVDGTTAQSHLLGADVRMNMTKGFYDGVKDGTALNDDLIIARHLADNAVETVAIKDANVTTAKIAADAITAEKMANGMVKNRQGGTTGDGSWNTVGTNNVDTSTKAVKIQCGTNTTGGTTVTITFPEAFTQAPIVIVTAIQASLGAWVQLDAPATTTQVTISGWTATGSLAALNFSWIAIGQ